MLLRWGLALIAPLLLAMGVFARFEHQTVDFDDGFCDLVSDRVRSCTFVAGSCGEDGCGDDLTTFVHESRGLTLRRGASHITTRPRISFLTEDIPIDPTNPFRVHDSSITLDCSAGPMFRASGPAPERKIRYQRRGATTIETDQTVEPGGLLRVDRLYLVRASQGKSVRLTPPFTGPEAGEATLYGGHLFVIEESASWISMEGGICWFACPGDCGKRTAPMVPVLLAGPIATIENIRVSGYMHPDDVAIATYSRWNESNVTRKISGSVTPTTDATMMRRLREGQGAAFWNTVGGIHMGDDMVIVGAGTGIRDSNPHASVYAPMIENSGTLYDFPEGVTDVRVTIHEAEADQNCSEGEGGPGCEPHPRPLIIIGSDAHRPWREMKALDVSITALHTWNYGAQLLVNEQTHLDLGFTGRVWWMHPKNPMLTTTVPAQITGWLHCRKPTMGPCSIEGPWQANDFQIRQYGE